MEKLRQRRPAGTAPAELPTAQRPAPAGSSAVWVQYGSMSESFDLSGMTVAEARGLLERPYRIAPEAQVTVNGNDPAADQRLRTGDRVEFVRRSGEKGAMP